MADGISRRAILKQTATIGATAMLGGVASSVRAAVDADTAFMSAVQLAEKLRSKQVGSEELTRFFISRIEQYDPAINAVVVRDFERALAAAKAADKALASGGDVGPLHGLPVTVKESYDIAGLPSTWGIPQAANNVAQADSSVVANYKRAGAVVMGKTNVPINLGDFQSYNAIYGTTNNPWDTSRTPGGSSGGSAAALAAGLTGLESGSDIGGSIRNPSHFCGVYGHKPTLGVISSQGHQPPGVPPNPQHPDLAVVGPMARSAEDLALALEVCGGPNSLMAPGWKLDLPAPRMTSLKGLRVALWPDEGLAPVDQEVSGRVQAVGDRLAQLGAKVSDTARPEFNVGMANQTYMGILGGMMGMPGVELKFSDYLGLNGARGALRVAWQKFFQDWDILLCPTTATAAFPQDQSDINERTLTINGEQRPYFEQVFWAGLATLCYLPSTVFPTGPSQSGLPIGLQAIGAEFDDRTTIEFTRLMAQEMGGFQVPPAYA